MPGRTMIRKTMAIATAAGAAVVIAILGNQAPQAQETPAVQTEPRVLTPGDRLSADDINFIEQPGRYGLGSDLRGSRYAIVDGHLVRIDPQTMELQSILRKDSVAFD
jgi:hypothetical protein